MEKIGSLLPALRLPSVPSGISISLRDGRGPRIVLTVHSEHCAGCIACVRELRTHADQFAEWGARVLTVVPATPEGAAEFHRQVPEAIVLADAQGLLATGAAAAIVADEWGEIHHVFETGERHDLPSGDELVEWARFLAIQCPECEGPEGEWRTLPGV